MLSAHFHYTTERNPATTEDFHSSGVEFDGDPFNISGTVVHSPDGAVFVSWTLSYAGGFRLLYSGQLIDECTIVGTRSYDFDPTFVDRVLELVVQRIDAQRPADASSSHHDQQLPPYVEDERIS